MNNNRSVVKHNAVKLRKQGKTLREIALLLKIPLSTAHLWTKSIQLTSDQLDEIKRRHNYSMQRGRVRAQKRRRKQLLTRREKIFFKGVKAVGTLTAREQLYIGAALYWSEGFKKDSRIGFANSDLKMIRFFLKWLIDECGVLGSQFRFRVGVNFSHKNRIEEIEAYWSSAIHYPMSQFQKPFFQKSIWKKHYRNSSDYYGVLRIRVNGNVDLFHYILGLVEGLRQFDE
jgi:hypothetical protein